MTLMEIFAKIESKEFSFLLGIVGSPRQLDREILRNAYVMELMKNIQENAHVGEAVAKRIMHLSQLEVAPEYQHPHDIQLATYMRVLDILNPALAEAVAPTVVRLPNVWWSRPIAIQLLKQCQFQSTTKEALTDAKQKDFAILWPKIENPNVIDIYSHPRIAGADFTILQASYVNNTISSIQTIDGLSKFSCFASGTNTVTT